MPTLLGDHFRENTPGQESFWRSPAGFVRVGFLAITGPYLWMEHRAHLLGALVWLPLLLCPLMHLFMHHGDGDDSGGSSSKGADQ